MLNHRAFGWTCNGGPYTFSNFNNFCYWCATPKQVLYDWTTYRYGSDSMLFLVNRACFEIFDVKSCNFGVKMEIPHPHFIFLRLIISPISLEDPTKHCKMLVHDVGKLYQCFFRTDELASRWSMSEKNVLAVGRQRNYRIFTFLKCLIHQLVFVDSITPLRSSYILIRTRRHTYYA